MNSRKNTVLIGIDGASFTMLQQLAEDGTMPNLKKLCKMGIFTQMEAPFPDNSAVSWSSIMTGDNPGKHGIFGFTDLISQTYTMRFPNFTSMKSLPFWLHKTEHKYVIINLPFTYPVKELNGYILSGFVSPDITRAVYPKDFLSFLKEIDYRTDVDSSKVYKSKDLFLDDLFDVHEKRVHVYKKLWAEADWDTFMVVFTESDRIGHFMLDAYEDQSSPYRERFLEYFSNVDEEIGWISEQLDESDILIMMSDHGMERIKTEVYLNTCLEKEGFLTLRDGDKKNYNNITEESLAFALEPSRIHLNYKGKYPCGSVNYDDRENILSDLTGLLRELTYNGAKVVAEVMRREEIYEGEQVGVAPDLVLIPGTGFSLRGPIGRKEIFESPNILSGMHRGDDAFLYVKGDNAHEIVPEKPKAEDIVKIMNKLEDQ